MIGAEMFNPLILMRPWRCHQGFGVLKVRIDVMGADRMPALRPGDIVLARFRRGDAYIADGWRIHGIRFLCVLNEPDVEVIEKP